MFATSQSGASDQTLNYELSHAELVAWGQSFGAQLPRPAVITLSGDLGTGKTTVTRAICAGLGVHDLDAVTSPTYALIHEYAAPFGTVVHADLYRLHTVAELRDLGWDELLATAAVVIVEWPELVAAELPPHTIALELRHNVANPDVRRLLVRTHIDT
jgi:tRNA threonylcarbamoyladenosine biosynthesis protein TsaE